MALKLYVVDDVAGTCELRGLVPYPTLTASSGEVTLNQTVDPVTGAVSYDISDITHTVDVNVDAFGYDPVTKDLTITETDGTVHTQNLGDLVDAAGNPSVVTQVATGNEIATHDDGAGTTVSIQETVTSAVVNGSSIDFTDEAGSVSSIGLCDLMQNTVDNGAFVGG